MKICKVKTITVFFSVALAVCMFGTAVLNAQVQQTQGKIHEKSLSVITVGSGIPGGTFGGRTEAMTVIQNKGKYIVLDCGYGTALRLSKLNYPVKNIDAIMFTHLHADHSMDFLTIMLTRWASGGREMELIGPPRTGDYYKFFKEFYRDDIVYRAMLFSSHTAKGALDGVNVREITGNKKFSIGDIPVESEEMVHTMYDLAYKFVIDGKIIVVTGDSSYNERIINFAKNADMVVFDGSFIIHALKPPENNAFDLNTFLKVKVDGKTYEPGGKYAGNFAAESHFNYSDIIKVSSRINPKKLILTHLYDGRGGKPDPQTDELKSKVVSDLKNAGFTGEVFFAVDGMEVGI
jgi:ribonuclease BN (tRNA processing enzyme)